jgi:hypothetical protein
LLYSGQKAETFETRVLLSASSSDPSQYPDPGSGSNSYPDPGSGSSSGSDSNNYPINGSVNIVFTEEFDWSPGSLVSISDEGVADFVNSVPFSVEYLLDTSASGPFYLVTEVNGEEYSRNEVYPSTYLQTGYSASAPLVANPVAGGSAFVADVNVRLEGPNGTVADDSDTDNSQDVATSAPDWLANSPFRFADRLRPGSAAANAMKGQIENQLDALFANYADEMFMMDPLGPTDDQIEAFLDPHIPAVSSAIYDEAFTIGVAGLNAAQDSTVGKWIFHTASRNKAVSGLGQLTSDSGTLLKNGIMADLYAKGKFTQQEVQDWISGNTPDWMKAVDEYVDFNIQFGDFNNFFEVPSFGTVLTDFGSGGTFLDYLKPDWEDQVIVKHVGANLPFGTEVFELPEVFSSYVTTGNVGVSLDDFTVNEPYPHGAGASASLNLSSPVTKGNRTIFGLSLGASYNHNIIPLPNAEPKDYFSFTVSGDIQYHGSIFSPVWKKLFGY